MNYFKPILIICSILAITKIAAVKAKDSLLFHPYPISDDIDTTTLTKQCQSHMRRVINKDITVNEFDIKSNNISLNAIIFRNPKTKYWMIFSHGNTGNIWSRLDLFEKYGKYCSIILYDYQGFGKSNGYPSESSLFNSIKTIWDYLANTEKVKSKYITLMGSSLGCSPTLWLGKELSNHGIHPKSIILRSPFSSLKDMASNIVPSFLSNILLSSEFDNKEYIKEINKTLIQIYHSKKDEIIPYNQALELSNYGNADFYEIGGDHNNPVFSSYCMNNMINGICKN